MPISDWIQFNQAYAKQPGLGPDAYQTRLTQGQETLYRKWLAATAQDTGVMYDPNDPGYDMRGFWRDKVASGNFKRMSKGQHFPDTYKTPYHPTFSRESKYATDDGPAWNENEELIDPATGQPTPGFLEMKARE